jgi:hypothetical protein
MGIIGNMLLGGMQGVGEGGAAAAKQWSAQSHEEAIEASRALQAEKLERLRQSGARTLQKDNQTFTAGENTANRTHQTNLQTGQQTFTAGENRENRTHQTNLQDRGFTHSENMQDRGFTHTENMQRAQQSWQGEQNDAQRGMTQAQIDSNERIARANRSNAMELAKMGGAVTQDKEGNMLWVDKAGKATPMMDPNNPGQPLKGFKDLTPAAKAFSDVLKAQLVDLDRMEMQAMGDPNQLATINQRRAALNGQLLNVLTIGADSMKPQPGAPAAGGPPPQAVADLRAGKGTAAQFDKIFGAGAAARAMGGSPDGQTPPSPPAQRVRAPEEQSAPGSPAANFRQGIIDRAAGQRQSVNMVRQSFDRDIASMDAQALYDQYDSLVGKLTPAQLSKYQTRLREIK